MKKMLNVVLAAAAILTIGGGTMTATAINAAASPAYSAEVASKIDALIKEKQEIIAQKKTTRDSATQKELGIRIGEIEKEIGQLKSGKATAGSSEAKQPEAPAKDNTARINELIKEKQALVDKKKVSRNSKEQKELGKQISAIEKEISQLKKAK